MKFFLTVILIASCSALAEYFLPWWSMAAVSFLLAFAVGLKPGKSFLAGFVGIAIFWLVAALYKDLPNEHILSSRMAVLFFKKPAYNLFIFVTVLVGGLVGGLAAWSGALFTKKRVRRSPTY